MCSHYFSWVIYAKAVESGAVKGCSKNDPNQLIVGPNIPMGTKGNYYVKTKAEPPYYIEKDDLYCEEMSKCTKTWPSFIVESKLLSAFF